MENDDVTAGHLVAGVLGLSLLRHWYVDGATNARRVAELRSVLDGLDDGPLATVLNPAHDDLQTGYGAWSGSYDGPNPFIAAEEEVVVPLLEALATPGTRALDAACGTGRHAAHLARLGCTTTGVDQSDAMLDVARAKVPGATFVTGDLRALPFDDGAFDLAVVALALSHLPDPADGLAELARVLRPGGRLVVADPHPGSVVLGGQAFYRDAAGALRWVRNHYHGASTWLRAFTAAGLEVASCQEPTYTTAQMAGNPAWSAFPEATRTAAEGLPFLWVWELVRR